MAQFSKFAPEDWKLFGGNVLMFLSGCCYIAWWLLSFYPGYTEISRFAPNLLKWTLVEGGAALVLLISGFSSRSVFPVWYIFIAAIVIYGLLMYFTTKWLDRPLTAELLILVVWASFEFAVLDVLYGNGKIQYVYAVIILVLVIIATVFGGICYCSYYSFEPMGRFVIGFLPLVLDTVVVLMLLVFHSVS